MSFPLIGQEPIFEIRKQFPTIVEELEQCPASFISKFQQLFPSKGSIRIPVLPKISNILIKVKGRSVGFTSGIFYNQLHYIQMSSEEEFWKRWNRFKNMTAFL